jgi:hypothetical protein
MVREIARGWIGFGEEERELDHEEGGWVDCVGIVGTDDSRCVRTGRGRGGRRRCSINIEFEERKHNELDLKRHDHRRWISLRLRLLI